MATANIENIRDLAFTWHLFEQEFLLAFRGSREGRIAERQVKYPHAGLQVALTVYSLGSGNGNMKSSEPITGCNFTPMDD
jgi:hypothetical protein